MKSYHLSRFFAAGSILLFLGAAGSLYAQGGGGGRKLDLSISPTSISFASADPDTDGIISANQTVNVRVKSNLRNNQTWELTLTADGDLIASGSTATIDISNISWTATPTPPFQGGTLAANVAQTAASANGSYNSTGYLTFLFTNSWEYWAGTYTQTITFTLSEV